MLVMCIARFNMVVLDNAFLSYGVTDMFEDNSNTELVPIFARKDCIEYDCETHNIHYVLKRLCPWMEWFDITHRLKENCRLFDSGYELYKRRNFIRSIINFSNYNDGCNEESLPVTQDNFI